VNKSLGEGGQVGGLTMFFVFFFEGGGRFFNALSDIPSPNYLACPWVSKDATECMKMRGGPDFLDQLTSTCLPYTCQLVGR